MLQVPGSSREQGAKPRLGRGALQSGAGLLLAGRPGAHQSIQRHSMIPVALAQKQPPGRWESAFSYEHEEFFEDYSSSCPVWKSRRLRKMETACPIRVPGLGLQGWNLGLSWRVYKNSTCLDRIPRPAICERLAHLLGTSRKAPLSFGEMGLDYSFRVTVSHADLPDTTFLTLTSPPP